MTRVITRPLKEDKDGIPGYIAFPEREEKGPGLLLIHQHSGLTGYLEDRRLPVCSARLHHSGSQFVSYARLSGGNAHR